MDVRVGHRHHDEEVGHRSVRGEPLVPVDDPLVAVAHRRRRQQRRVRSRRLRLGHGEGRPQRRRRAGAAATSGACSSSPVASIPTASNSALPESGALLPKTTGASGDCPRISCIRPSRTCPNPMPPSAGGRCAAHRPCALTSLLQRPDHHADLVVGQIERLEREHLLPHEAAHPLQLLLELGLGREIPGHAIFSLLRRRRSVARLPEDPHPATTVGAVPTASPVTFRPDRPARQPAAADAAAAPQSP